MAKTILVIADVLLLLTDIALVVGINRQDKKAQAERKCKN